jgi:hypothetical protein
LFHIELDTHEAVLAEGLAVESFRLDNQLTHAFWFDNADEYARLYGAPGEPPASFAPIVRYRSSRQELASHMRSAFAPVYDFRKPIEKVRDRIIDRLDFAHAAASGTFIVRLDEIPLGVIKNSKASTTDRLVNDFLRKNERLLHRGYSSQVPRGYIRRSRIFDCSLDWVSMIKSPRRACRPFTNNVDGA